MKLCVENTRDTLEDIEGGKVSLNETTKMWAVTPKMDKWDYLKLKSFCIAKETISGENSSHNGKKYLQT